VSWIINDHGDKIRLDSDTCSSSSNVTLYSTSHLDQPLQRSPDRKRSDTMADAEDKEKAEKLAAAKKRVSDRLASQCTIQLANS